MPADFNDRTDFENADRGFVASIEPMTVRDAGGRQVWDMDGWAFLEGPCPDTANPSLWRQGQLNCRHGLYEVTDGIYQVRGFDLSNMTLVESDHGVIVIDPLVSQETAAAALALYRAHRGDRAVTAVIYTHAHIDHFGACSAWSTPTPGCRSWHPSTSWSTPCPRTCTPGPLCCAGATTTAGWRSPRAPRERWAWGSARRPRRARWA